jgi:hypothetical protein
MHGWHFLTKLNCFQVALGFSRDYFSLATEIKLRTGQSQATSLSMQIRKS